MEENKARTPGPLIAYFFRTCSETTYDRLFDKYKQEYGDYKDIKQCFKWMMTNIQDRDFEILKLLAEEEAKFGPHKDPALNLNPSLREVILERVAELAIEKVLLGD